MQIRDPALEALYAQRLTIDEFATEFNKLYPDSYLVRPDVCTTMEMRWDNSRFYPQYEEPANPDNYDEEFVYRVIGGSFH